MSKQFSVDHSREMRYYPIHLTLIDLTRLLGFWSDHGGIGLLLTAIVAASPTRTAVLATYVCIGICRRKLAHACFIYHGTSTYRLSWCVLSSCTRYQWLLRTSGSCQAVAPILSEWDWRCRVPLHVVRPILLMIRHTQTQCTTTEIPGIHSPIGLPRMSVCANERSD